MRKRILSILVSGAIVLGGVVLPEVLGVADTESVFLDQIVRMECSGHSPEDL